MSEADQDYLYGPVGERLRRAREAKGMTLEDVATQTRIPIRHLRNIEDENWADLPASTYTVGFGRSYANAVGLDGAEVARELREQVGNTTRAPSVSPTVYAPPDPARVPSRSLAWIAGLVLVVLVVGYLFLRNGRNDETAAAQQTEEAQPQPEPQQPAQPQPQAPQDLTGQPVTLVATGEVWFRISDQNRRVEDRTLQPQGQYQVPASLTAPTIATGRPQLLRVNVAGRDLGPLAPEERRITGVSLLANDIARQIQGGAPAASPPR